MQKSPEEKDTYTLLGVAYINLRQYTKAITVMKRLLVLEPDAMVAYYYMGAVYGTYLKQPALALQMYRKILDRDPRNVSKPTDGWGFCSHYWKASTVAMAFQHLEEAGYLRRGAMQAHPDYRDAWIARARRCLQQSIEWWGEALPHRFLP